VPTLRTAATVIALLALLGVAVRPRWHSTAPAHEGVLVTAGADPATVRRLADSLGRVPVFLEARAARRDPSLRRLHIVGWGLDPEIWRALDSIPVSFHPAPAAAGIRYASWPATVSLGEDLVVEGELGNPAAFVALVDPGGAADSVPVDARTFRVVAHPRALGPMLCVLRASLHDRPVAAETIGVMVVPPPAPRVLILESAPRFDTRALRDWLARRHGAVAIRSAVSRNRYRSEFVNRDRDALTPVSPRLLSQFDVVVIDGRSLAALTAGERRALRSAVTASGLGVLLEPDSVLLDRTAGFSDRDFLVDFAFRPIPGLERRTIRPAWPGSDRRALTDVAAEPYTLAPRFGTETLFDDGSDDAVAQVTYRGAGRIGVSLVRESSRWVRAGERDAFSAYWSRLLTAIAGSGGADRWEIVSPGPWLVDHPITLAVETTRDQPVGVVTAPSGVRDSVFLSSDPLTPGRWQGRFWPREAGWHRIEGPAASGFYAQPADTWRGRQSAMLLDASRRYVVASASLDGAAGRKPGTVVRAIPAAWFFGTFLLCCGVLWARRRAA
jgi:hypothetical protein